jgi:selenocysteine-specific elongation factor
MHVVATAGHVDHGKSTLVRALTGSDPDRLEEEHRRGLSIELGYCWTELPGVGEVAFVDVPGHQRFIATALAGVGPVPVAMLVVAADDPWMPQAAEHLAALDALGVEHGVLVVTRADLADPEPALLRSRAEVDGTSLRGAPSVVVSGRSGVGLDRLRRTLATVLSRIPAPDPEAPVRLWVDRRFHVRGTGTVVTGTLPAGTIAVGDILLAEDAKVRVRALESLERSREQVSGVARVAVDLGGRAPEGLSRGSTLTTLDAWETTTIVDVALTDTATTATLPEGPLLHIGSAQVPVHARPLGNGFARLVLRRPLPLRVGDRAILRDPGSRALWGVRILDPAPPPLRRRGAAAQRAQALAGHDGTLAAELRIRGVVRRSVLRRAGAPVDGLPDGAVSVGDWLAGPEVAGTWRERLADLVAAAGAGDPLTTAAAAHRLGLPDPDLVEALVAPPLRLDRGRIVDAGSTDLEPRLQAALDRLVDELAEAPFSAPSAERLLTLGLDARTTAILHRSGHLLRLADKVVLLPGADDLAVEVLGALAQPFTASEARTALGTSRRVALPLLAHLDDSGRTVRLADDSRRLRRDGPG